MAQEPALTYLPYWIEVSGGVAKAKISALDSGRGLSSPINLNTYEQVKNELPEISTMPESSQGETRK
jgi:hypothetical protein